MARVISGVCDFVCVRSIKVNGLSYPSLVHVHSMVVAPKVKGQRHTVTKNVTVAWLLVVIAAVVLLLPAWDCTSYDCLDF